MPVEVNIEGLLELNKDALISGDNHEMREALQTFTTVCNEHGEAKVEEKHGRMVMDFRVVGSMGSGSYNHFYSSLHTLSSKYAGPGGGYVRGEVGVEMFHEYLGSPKQQMAARLYDTVAHVDDAIFLLKRHEFTQDEVNEIFNTVKDLLGVHAGREARRLGIMVASAIQGIAAHETVMSKQARAMQKSGPRLLAPGE